MRHDERRWRWRRLVRATPATTSAASALISAPTTTTAAARLSFGRVGEASAKRLNEESEEDEEEEEEDEEEDALARPRKNEADRPKKRRGRRRTDRRNAMLNSVSNLALVFAGCVCVCVCFGTALAQTQAQQPPQNGASGKSVRPSVRVAADASRPCVVVQNCRPLAALTPTLRAAAQVCSLVGFACKRASKSRRRFHSVWVRRSGSACAAQVTIAMRVSIDSFGDASGDAFFELIRRSIRDRPTRVRSAGGGGHSVRRARSYRVRSCRRRRKCAPRLANGLVSATASTNQSIS